MTTESRNRPRLLLVSLEAELSFAVDALLFGSGFDVERAPTVTPALERRLGAGFDVLVLGLAGRRDARLVQLAAACALAGRRPLIVIAEEGDWVAALAAESGVADVVFRTSGCTGRLLRLVRSATGVDGARPSGSSPFGAGPIRLRRRRREDAYRH